MDLGAGEEGLGSGGGEGVFGEEHCGGGGFHVVDGSFGGFGAELGVVGFVVGDALEGADGLDVCVELYVGNAGDAAGHRGLLVGSVDGYPRRAILPLVMRKCKCHFGGGAGERMRCGGGGRDRGVPGEEGLDGGDGEDPGAGRWRAGGEGGQAVAGLGEPELCRTQESWCFCTGVWKESKAIWKEYTGV